MSNCKLLSRAQEKARHWRRVARKRRLALAERDAGLAKARRRLERVVAVVQKNNDVHEAYSNSAEKEINRLSCDLEEAEKEIERLKGENLTIPSEHSFAEHEAHVAAKARIAELEAKQYELKCSIARILDYDETSLDYCDVLAEVATLKHDHANAMEVLAATTRQRDQLNSEINVLKITLITRDTELAELKKALAPKVYPQ